MRLAHDGVDTHEHSNHLFLAAVLLAAVTLMRLSVTASMSGLREEAMTCFLMKVIVESDTVHDVGE